MTCFNSWRRMRARPTGGVAEDARASAMTAGLVFPIVYPPARGRASTAEWNWHFQDEPISSWASKGAKQLSNRQRADAQLLQTCATKH